MSVRDSSSEEDGISCVVKNYICLFSISHSYLYCTFDEIFCLFNLDMHKFAKFFTKKPEKEGQTKYLIHF